VEVLVAQRMVAVDAVQNTCIEVITPK
jgi:hypothetical protein